ncbi:unnamed protein product [Protopolystoma xenopodis]|uniref:Uncharacterized protein n=1 Tax=Protopolystoma xenopodis TaxID=117903 RepID=A0A3S5A2M3_9PLAT|nr:unnamed protein product [Protopolystoma xenopodis]
MEKFHLAEIGTFSALSEVWTEISLLSDGSGGYGPDGDGYPAFTQLKIYPVATGGGVVGSFDASITATDGTIAFSCSSVIEPYAVFTLTKVGFSFPFTRSETKLLCVILV